MDDKSIENNVRNFDIFTVLAEKVSKGIYEFDIDEAYRREMNKEGDTQKRRKKFAPK